MLQGLLTTWPGKEYRIIAILFICCAGLNLIPLFRRWFDAVVRWEAKWLRYCGLFTLSDPFLAQRRLDFVRILVGLAVLYRCASNTTSTFVAGPAIFFPQMLSTSLGVLLLLGVATPVTIILILLTQNLWFVPIIYRIANLPSAVMAIALVPLLICPAGRTLSIDAVLMRRNGFAGRMLTRIYGLWGNFHPDRLVVGLFAAMLGYWMVCISACLYHLEDPGWRSGMISAILLSSPLINRSSHELFDALYWFWPMGFVLFSQISTFAMLVWEGLLFPLSLSRWTRWWVILYGLLFFTLSWFVLQLNFLVAVELSLWIGLYWQKWGIPDATTRLQLHSFGRLGSILRRLLVLDIFHAVEVATVTNSPSRLTIVDAQGVNHSGLAALERIVARVLLFQPAWPVVWLMAKMVSNTSPEKQEVPAFEPRIPAWAIGPSDAPSGWILRTTCCLLSVMLLVFTLTLPGMSVVIGDRRLEEKVDKVMGRSARLFGLSPVLVFDTRYDNFSFYLHLSKSDNMQTSESLRYRTRMWFAPYREGARIFELGYLPDAWNPLVDGISYFESDDPYWLGVCLLRGPTPDDLRAFRYVPWRTTEVVNAEIDPETKKVTRLKLSQEGVDEYLAHRPLVGRVDAEMAWLIRHFPIQAEIQRLVYWYEHPDWRQRYTTENLDWTELVRLYHDGFPPVDILPKVEHLVTRFGLEWSLQGPQPPAQADPLPDLELARHYYYHVFDKKLRLATHADLEAAEQAARKGLVVQSLLHSAAVRRAFFDELFLDRP